MGHKVGSGTQNWGMAHTVPPLQCAPGFCCYGSGNLQALKIAQEVLCELYSSAMNLGNRSPAQFFGLFTAGELNFSKRTWMLGRVLFGLKFELKLVYFCLWHLLPGIINSSGSGSFLHFRSSQDSSPLSCLKLILLIPNPEYRVFLVFLQSQSSFQLFGMYQQRLTNT